MLVVTCVQRAIRNYLILWGEGGGNYTLQTEQVKCHQATCLTRWGRLQTPMFSHLLLMILCVELAADVVGALMMMVLTLLVVGSELLIGWSVKVSTLSANRLFRNLDHTKQDHDKRVEALHGGVLISFRFAVTPCLVYLNYRAFHPATLKTSSPSTNQQELSGLHFHYNWLSPVHIIPGVTVLSPMLLQNFGTIFLFNFAINNPCHHPSKPIFSVVVSLFNLIL